MVSFLNAATKNKQNAEISEIPAQRPSMISMIFIALVIPIIHKTVSATLMYSGKKSI
jgi:hypothetical protein